MKYGWFIRGRNSKLFVGVSGLVLRALETPHDATMYPTAEEARRAVASFRMVDPLTLEIVDMVVHDPLPPDADRSPVRTRAQVIQDAKDEDKPREAQRRATWGLVQKAVAVAVALAVLAFNAAGAATASPRDNPFPPLFQQWSPPAHAADHSRARHYAHRHAPNHRAVADSRGGARGFHPRIEQSSGGLVNVFADRASAAVAVAERYIGGNPTGHASLWCADFANLIEHQLGRAGTKSREALSFLRYGPHVDNPAPGDLVVLGRRGGGHVGYLVKQTAAGPLIISGNHNHRVGVGVYPRGNVIAYVRPS